MGRRPLPSWSMSSSSWMTWPSSADVRLTTPSTPIKRMDLFLLEYSFLPHFILVPPLQTPKAVLSNSGICSSFSSRISSIPPAPSRNRSLAVSYTLSLASFLPFTPRSKKSTTKSIASDSVFFSSSPHPQTCQNLYPTLYHHTLPSTALRTPARLTGLLSTRTTAVLNIIPVILYHTQTLPT